MRKTKIICTLGPASARAGVLRRMIEKGADAFRINMSHATHEWVREIVPQVRAFARELRRPIALLLDTQGPAIRTGDVKADLQLKPGDVLEFTVRGSQPKERYSVEVNYGDFPQDVAPGDTVLVDNGMIKLLVLDTKKDRVRSKVLTPATLGSRRHINLPGVYVRLPPLTRKDLADVALGAELGVEFVALSFVREKSDIEQLRKLLAKKKSRARIIAKIENQLAVRALDTMIESADAIMVARGDLGIECPMEELPVIQRRIVKRCLRFGKPVVVATQLLESMIANPSPTRAEVTDVANAVFEQADALLLSGETTVGKYPVKCVEVFDRIARRIERSGGAGYAQSIALEDMRRKLVASAVVLANSLDRAKIVVFTRSGTMARNVANMRPERAPIFAFTPSEEVQRQLSISWGVSPLLLKFRTDPNATIEAAEKYVRENKLTERGDHLVVITDLQAGRQRVDTVQLRPIK